MKRLLQTVITSAALAMSIITVAALPQSVLASTPNGQGCVGKACIEDGAGNVNTGATDTIPETIQQVTDILLFLLGAVSVIMLVIGGFKFVTSNGNAEQVKSAKNTIMYAIIGVVVALLAYAIIDFVVDNL